MWIYRLLISLAAPLLWAHRIWRSGGAFEAIRPAQAPRNQGHTLWIHAASNGEITSAKPLLQELLERDPALHLAITVNTPSAVSMAQGWSLPRSHVSYAPLDLRWRINGFLKAVRPAAILIIENEFWPNKILTAHAYGVPVLVAGARLSKTSARRWRLLPKLAHRMTQAITQLSPQDPASAQRFRDLGLPAEKILPELNLKLFYTPPAVDAPKTDRLQTILAASTHDGEDIDVVTAFAAAHRLNPSLRLIIAPRHPRRAQAILDAAQKHGLAIAQRSAGAAFDDEAPIWLADTMGEMAQWYSAAGLCFVGGSLVDKGGHTPFEPAAHGMGLLTGPHIENFEPHFEALQAEAAAQIVPDAEALRDAFIALPNTSKLRKMGQTAQAYHARKGSLDPLIDAIRATL
ncbi:MAG: glycosyltransferase N-terminal domain-containing protein [Pseudomonadota bacterium]